ncbi:MAG: PQQ-dependent sugar dehydrogenase [Sphaerospermopsis sp.]|nr:PQQ-dependent sugar dehydrogenase [Sphaerospermopsis sp.]
MKQTKTLAAKLLFGMVVVGISAGNLATTESANTNNQQTQTAQQVSQQTATNNQACTLVENGFGSQGQVKLRVEEVVTGLEVPWGIAFLPNQDMLVTERPGRVRLVRNGQLIPQPVATINVTESGEDGLLGIATHPNFAENRFFYIYYTADKNGSQVNRVERWRLSQNGLTASPDKVIVDNIPVAQFHNGGRIRFGPDGMLYIGTGDAREPQISQDVNSLAGKILRVTPDGQVLQGAKMAQQILWDLQVPFREREAVVALVKYGSLPLWFWDKPNPEKAVIKTSQIIRCDLLSLLTEADVRGRYCDDQAQLLERIAFFREFCQENQCFHQSRIFPSDHSRFIYFQKENGHPDYVAYDDTRLQVVMMSGLPGVGKDTWIQENLSDWPVISLDELRKTLKISPEEDQGAVINAAKALAKDYLRTGQSFVWNATNISRQLRSSLIRQFVNYQGKIRIVYLETSWEELLQRNRDRAAKLPEKVLDKLRNRLEVPDITEAQTVDWIVH